MDIRPGVRVRIERLESTTGMLIPPRYLDNRRVGAEGVVEKWAAVTGGDVWWVRQENGTIAAYSICEMRIVGGDPNADSER